MTPQHEHFLLKDIDGVIDGLAPRGKILRDGGAQRFSIARAFRKCVQRGFGYGVGRHAYTAFGIPKYRARTGC